MLNCFWYFHVAKRRETECYFTETFGPSTVFLYTVEKYQNDQGFPLSLFVSSSKSLDVGTLIVKNKSADSKKLVREF